VYAIDITAPTEVAFSHAQVWNVWKNFRREHPVGHPRVISLALLLHKNGLNSTPIKTGREKSP
jgi:hypothetical protein